MLRVCLVTFALCAITVQGGKQKRAVGGVQYADGEYPEHVSLWYFGDNNFYTQNTPDLHHTCGGTLIAPSWVLTSAGCFDGNYINGLGNTSLWQVWLGMYAQTDATREAQLRFIDSIHFPESYALQPVLKSDIALLKLNEPADLSSEFVDIADINEDPSCPVTGEQCVVIGWGQRKESPYGEGSNYPFEVEVLVEDNVDCAAAYAEPQVVKDIGTVKVTQDMICAGWPTGGQDACYGDSGSPLLCSCPGLDEFGELVRNEVVTGTVSGGYGCGRAGYPAVYTRVSSFVDWIQQTIMSN